MAKNKTRKKKGISLATKIARDKNEVLNRKKFSGHGKPQIVKGTTIISKASEGIVALSQARLEQPRKSIHRLKNLLATKSMRNQLVPCNFPENYQIRDDFKYPYTDYGLEFDLEFESLILASFGEEISAFLSIKEQFDNAFLIGDIVKAKALLSEAFKSFGYSNWYLSSYISVLYVEDKHKEILEYSNEVIKAIKDNNFNEMSKVQIEYVFSRGDKGVSFERYYFAIQNQAEEFRISKDSIRTEHIDFDHFYSPENDYKFLSEAIAENSSNNIIDRYLNYKRILASCALQKVDIENIKSTLISLNNSVKDKVLNNILYTWGIVTATVDATDEKLIKICDSYMAGDYEKVIKESEELLQESPTTTSCIEIYVKSLIRCDKQSELEGTVSNFITEILGLYKTGGKLEYIKNLQKEFLRFYHCDWAFFLKLQCHKFTPSIPQKSLERLYLFVDIQSSLANPFSKIRFDNSVIEKLSFRSPSFEAVNSEPYQLDSETLKQIDDKRLLKLQGDHLFNNGNYDEAKRVYLELSKSGDSLFQIHALSKSLSCDFECARYPQTISEISGLLVESQIPNQLPIIKVSNYIIESKNNGLSVDELVDRAIVIFFYNKLKNNEKSHFLTLLCENVFEELEIEKPEHFDVAKSNKYAFLAEKVLKPEVIESFDIFDSQESVYIFRILLIQHLFSANSSQSKEQSRKSDLFQTFDKLVKEKCVSECGSGRIEVDTLAIKNGLLQNYSHMFEYIKTLNYEGFKEEDYLQLVNDKESYNVSSNELFSKLLELYLKVRDEYTISPLYGLDNFLNMNIRHGGIVNLLWSSIKKNKLSYLKNKKGFYEVDKYWDEQYPYMIDKNRQVLHQAFITFSQDIDKLVQKAKGWIHINTGEFHNEEKLFSFPTDSDDIEILGAEVEGIHSFEIFIDKVVDRLDERTETALKEIESLINGQLRTEINDSFSKLAENIKGIFHLEQLNKQIKLSQRETNERIDELITWFSWKNETTQPYVLGASIEAAKEMAISLHPQFKIEIELIDDVTRSLKGETFRRFVTVFLILIDNAVIHSGLPDYLNMSFHIMEDSDGKVLVKSKNFIDKSKVETTIDKSNKINSIINERYILEASEESGSGTFKIKKILSFDINVNNNIEIVIDKTESSYSIEMTLDLGELYEE
jgi:hypothetical protein